MNNYCSTCLGYIASDPCDGCDGTEENHIYYEPDFARKDTKPRYIDADALKHELCIRQHMLNADSLWKTLEIMDAQPTADVAERKKGKWMGTVCSACGESCSYHFDAKYCPNCGADMRGEKTDDGHS